MSSQNRALAALFATLLIDMIGIGMVFPIIPIIFTDPNSHSFLLQGYPESLRIFFVGLVTALFGLMQFIAAPILGELSDIYGRKRLLLMGVGVLAFSQALFGFGIETASLGIILFSRLVAGIAGGNFSIAQAVIADVSDAKDRVRNFGLIGAAFGLGFIIGPVLSGWVAAATQSAAAPFWLASMLGMANFMSVYFLLPETRTGIRERSSRFSLLTGVRNIQTAALDTALRRYYTVNFAYYVGFAFFTSTIGLLLVERFSYDEAGIGFFFGIVGAWVVLTQGMILRVVSRIYGEMQLLRVTVPLVGMAVLAFGIVSDPHLLYIVIPCMAIPQGISMANLMSLLSKHVSPEKQGASLGINGSLQAFSQGAVPLVSGTMAALLGIPTTLIIGSFFFFVAWYLLPNN